MPNLPEVMEQRSQISGMQQAWGVPESLTISLSIFRFAATWCKLLPWVLPSRKEVML